MNPHWGDELAQANGVQGMPKSRSHMFGLGALLCGVLVAPIAAGVLWAVGHPDVRVDVAGADAAAGSGSTESRSPS